MKQPQIRPATIEDVDAILQLIQALADYEKEPDAVKATSADIRRSLFGDAPNAFCLICEAEGQIIGFALYFFNYSTWLGKNGIYLEDLFVLPQYRNIGAGKLLLKALAKEAVNNNCGRLEWSVLNWNQLAIDFYLNIGAKPQDEWTVYRLEDEALERLANE